MRRWIPASAGMTEGAGAAPHRVGTWLVGRVVRRLVAPDQWLASFRVHSTVQNGWLVCVGPRLVKLPLGQPEVWSSLRLEDRRRVGTRFRKVDTRQIGVVEDGIRQIDTKEIRTAKTSLLKYRT